MYDDSSITETESLSPHASIASILGIKGGLRLRHHTVSQKAHVILRRVEPSEDSTDDEDASNVVSFRLFSAKHINLKPGKELLLTVASVDGRLKDRVVIFEGDLRRSEEDSDHEGTTQVEEEPQVIEEEEDSEPIPQSAMPPKMRRQWTRKVEEVSPVVFKMPVAHASMGVQAQPDYTSASIQACSTQTSVSIQVQPSTAFASTETVSSYASSAVQADPSPLPSYISLDIQTDPVLSSFDLPSIQPYPGNNEFEHAPSLSPMLLSAPGSPVLPLFLGFPPSREATVKMELSPPLTAVKMEQFDEIIPPPPQVAVQVKQEPVKKEFVDLALSPHPHAPPLPPPSRSVADTLAWDDPFHSHSQTSRPAPRNSSSFVSGGFVTDFVGTGTVLPVPVPDADALEEGELPFVSTKQRQNEARRRRRAAKRAREGAAAAAAAAATAPPQPTQPVPPQPTQSTPPEPTHPAPPPPPQPAPPLPEPPAPQRVRATGQNAVASSSKVISESLFSPGPSSILSRATTNTSALPRELMSLVGRAKEKAPASANKQSQHDSDGISPSSGSTPPPEPKSIAYIPSGPVSNPLNIRPSSSSLSRPTMLPPVLARPAAAAAATKAKKRVILGRGWPFVRVGATTGAPVPTTSQSPAKSGGLSSIVAYSSPSPPPDPPVSKWKRIDSEISVAVGSREDSPIDMDLSAPPSPVGDGGHCDGVPALASLKDRISEATATEPPKLLDRMSTLPRSTTEVKAGSSPKPECSSLLSRMFPEQSPAQPDPAPAFIQRSLSQGQLPHAAPAATSTQKPIPSTASSNSGKKRSVQLPTHHPLPAKPPVSNVAPNPPRGIKRERPPSPDLWTAPGIVRIPRRKPRWPTIHWTHSELLKGDGDLGVRRIVFSPDGSCFALHCWDRTLRIWDARTQLEIAQLSHNAQIIGLAWVDGEAAVMSLGEDGVLAKWTRVANYWEWGRLINVGSEKRALEDTVCLAHTRDRIAVAFPRSGVKVWKWCRGSWLAQRSIMRTNVTALKFVEGGDALLGGTREGAVWHCAVPNGTMKVYAFLQSSITSIDINPTGTHALIAQAGGSACLVRLGLYEEKRVAQSYVDTGLRDGGPGAVFSTEGQAVLFGAVEGSLLVWDTHKGAVIYGMEHEEDDLIQAVASCGGPQGCVVTGTRQGRLAWWPQPAGKAQCSPNASRKRAKVK